MPIAAALLAALAVLPARPVQDASAQDAALDAWPSFRGARACGVSTGPAPPAGFDLATGENVLWRVPVPGLGHASPVVWGGRVLVATAVRLEGAEELSSLYGSPGYGAGESVPDEGPHAWQVHCFDATSGALLWARTAHVGIPQVRRHPKASHASSTPTVDGERVVAFFGSEGVHAFSHDGQHLWSRDLGVLDAGAPDLEDSDPYQWGFASSPVLHDGRVLVQCDVQGQSFLAALDATSGADVWRTLRDEEPTWCSPTVVEGGADGRAIVVANGYHRVGGYDLATGEPVWWLSGGGDVPVPTPVAAHGLVYLTSAHGPSRPLTALHATARGEVSRDPEESEYTEWNHTRRGIYMQTPLALGNLLYACSDGGVLGCYDAHTGEEVYRERLLGGDSGFTASPVAAGDRVFAVSEHGQVVALRAGREHEVLATSDLGEVCMATPAIADGVLYVRTRHHLVAIGARTAAGATGGESK